MRVLPRDVTLTTCGHYGGSQKDVQDIERGKLEEAMGEDQLGQAEVRVPEINQWRYLVGATDISVRI